VLTHLCRTDIPLRSTKRRLKLLLNSDDFDVSSSRRTPPRDNNDSDTRPSTIRSAVEAPPSPYRSSPPSSMTSMKVVLWW
jgi:hypothetical protein